MSILAVLHIIGGGVTLILLAGFGQQLGGIGPSLGTSPLLAQLSILFLGVLGLASGVGMWRGTVWGWWLAGFYYAFAIYRNANAMLVISGLAEQLSGEVRGPGYYYFKHTGRIITHALVLFYLFRTSVLAYFGLSHLAKGPALVQMVKPIAAIILVQFLTALL